MDDCLVMLFVKSEKVTFRALRGLGWTNSAFVKYDLDFSKVRAPRPGFENTLTYVHEEVYSASNNEIYVVGMVTFLINILTILNFQGLG